MIKNLCYVYIALGAPEVPGKCFPRNQKSSLNRDFIQWIIISFYVERPDVLGNELRIVGHMFESVSLVSDESVSVWIITVRICSVSV